ncbi:MDR family MFS transporter [Aspergillus tanneri]|uniref:Major facilitator superfamily (MFS) profile domain-containing protein n=1 Tax=Aspergillus tanneri TaxID=1220188 RepID=A0A5M9N1J5_9EURO|nr:uncharacterized protein ATNIH1004_000372 [Aspergillus tanneri]KAA8651484.1 hypothetical protein ATNIH1004_000372 [Aspergillus tanneri]
MTESSQDPEKQTVELQLETRRGLQSSTDGVKQDKVIDNNYATGVKVLMLISAVTLMTFLTLLDQSIIATAIPQITSQFHSLPDLGWYGSAYQLACASLQPLSGKLYASFPSKWMYLSCVAIFELGSLLCGIANSSKMLIVGRAVAGMGASGLNNGALSILANSTPLEKRPMHMGIMMGIAQMGLVIGPLLGGAFTEHVTWRLCFYINLPIGAVVAGFLLFLNIPEPVVKTSLLSVLATLPSKLDLVGFALLAPSAIQLLLALEYGGNEYAWNSSMIIGLFCGAGVTFLIFLYWESRQGGQAMTPLPMLRQRIVWTSCVNQTSLIGMTLCTSYFLPMYFQAVKGVSPTLSGVDLLPTVLSQLVGTVICGALASSVITAIGNGLISTFTPSTSTGKWIGYQILIGTGRGLGFQVPIVAVQNTLSPAQIPVAMALLMFCQTLGGAVFLVIANVIFSASLRTEIPWYAPGIDPETVIGAGASSVRDVVTSTTALAGTLTAYATSVGRVFYLAVGLSGIGLASAWGMGWKDIRKKGQ